MYGRGWLWSGVSGQESRGRGFGRRVHAPPNSACSPPLTEAGRERGKCEVFPAQFRGGQVLDVRLGAYICGPPFFGPHHNR